MAKGYCWIEASSRDVANCMAPCNDDESDGKSEDVIPVIQGVGAPRHHSIEHDEAKHAGIDQLGNQRVTPSEGCNRS